MQRLAHAYSKAPNVGVLPPTTSLALIDRLGDFVTRGATDELTSADRSVHAAV